MFGIPKKTLLSAIAIALSSSFLLAGYEFSRSVTEPFFIKFYSKESLPEIMLLIPLMTFALVYLNGLALNYLGPKKTIISTCLLTGIILFICYYLIHSEIAIGSAFLYLFVYAYIVIIIEQYWSYINSILSTSYAKKLNGIFLGISCLGGIVGGIFAKQFPMMYGAETSILVAALLMIPTTLLSYLGYYWGGEPALEKHESKDHSGTFLFVKTPYLIKIGVLVLISQVFIGLLELSLWNIVPLEITTTDAQSTFKAGLFLKINIMSVIFQFIVTPLLTALLPLSLILLLIPIINLVCATTLVFSPSLLVASFAFGAFKVLDYSIFRATKEPLYIPLNFNERYRAKQVVDSFIYRAAKGGLTGGVMSLWKRMAGLLGLAGIVVASYSVFAVVAAGVWIIIVQSLRKDYKKIAKEQDENKA